MFRLHTVALCLLALLPLQASAQVTVGDRPAKAEETLAKMTLAKLDAKKFTLDQGEFEELIPKKGSVAPFLWIASNDIVTVHEIEKGQSHSVIGKRRGTNGTKFDYHKFAPRDTRWALVIANKQPEPTYTKDGKPIPSTATIHVLKNGDNGTPDEADLVVITLGEMAPDVPPIKPDIKPDVKPDVKPAVDAELVKQFKASLALDKADAAAKGYDWKYASVWIQTYSDTSAFLKITDPAVAAKTLADLYEKHKLTWQTEGVPARPFLEKTREVIDGLFDASLGKNLKAPIDGVKTSDLFKRIANALTEAMKP